jgi:hypothetical protein
LSDEDINDPKLVIPLGAKMMRDIYEHHSAKDAELIQQLVDALANLRDIHEFRVGREPLTGMDELAAAAAAGFKPTTP